MAVPGTESSIVVCECLQRTAADRSRLSKDYADIDVVRRLDANAGHLPRSPRSMYLFARHGV
jgi:hypothetical protein